LKPKSENKPIVKFDTVSFPTNVSKLSSEQRKFLIELIKQEFPYLLSETGDLRVPNTSIKSETKTFASSCEYFSLEYFGTHYYYFDNPLFLSPLVDQIPEEKSTSIGRQGLGTIHINCKKQGIVSPTTSSILLIPQNPNATNMAADRMDQIVAARYTPLVLPQVMYAFPPNDYMRYLPRFNEEGSVTAEDHLNSFYSFVDNFNVEHADVWMR
jgi:hypothetical protein